MSATAPSHGRNSSLYESREGLDVDWLLHSKKGLPSQSHGLQSGQEVKNGQPLARAQVTASGDASTQDVKAPAQAYFAKSSKVSDGAGHELQNGIQGNTKQPSLTTRLDGSRKDGAEESKQSARAPLGQPKKESRRSSWISSLGHKLSGGSTNSKQDSGAKSPKHEQANPFETKSGKAQERKVAQNNDEPPVMVPNSPRRPSVLVAAGTETRVESPGFLGALRRLSSGNVAGMGKGAGSGAACPRKIMNVDHHRDRITIPELDQNKLKRVAFCVDVEIAGVSAHAEENQTQVEPVGTLPKSHTAQAVESNEEQKDSKSAKYKEKGEGAALKNPQNATQEKEQLGKTKVDLAAEASEEQRELHEGSQTSPERTEVNTENPPAPTMTRKKEKKKRSEAERKERKERKRRHAEQNGLVPLEITRDEDDSDTTSGNNTPGSHTPRKHGDQPTTDPLRIYKRCCQLRETTALTAVKDQIVQPAATLAEAPGTVAIIDLTGVQMALQDITTLGDWLAVVPVRKLILESCNLTDEGLRVILSGLLSCKTTAQARYNRKLNKQTSGKPAKELMGFIEKLSLKNNPGITSVGWKHIALFMHMSRSLIAVDLTGIPYPNSVAIPPNTNSDNTGPASAANGSLPNANDVSSLLSRAIGDRQGDKLKELIVTNCNLSSSGVADIVNAAIKCKISRLGLAANNLSGDVFTHVVRYVMSGFCEGLDLGGNNLHNTGQFLTEALDANNPLIALSIADCNLEPDDLNAILPRFTTLKDFKFIDLSRNKGLFNESKTAVPLFRKYMPKMQALKRLHLADVNMLPDHVIALAEMFPTCPSLCHINLVENECLVGAMNSKSAEEQEEATAFLAALMTAVRVSQRIVAIEIEVPSQETSEVIRALASQIVAYSLMNMEKSALYDMGVAGPPDPLPDKNAPEVLLHLVGHMDGYSENHDQDEPAPDEDYVIASSGIAKALGVCLRNQGASRMGSRNISPNVSGAATPRKDSNGTHHLDQQNKPKDVGLELCESARKIRMRLRPALVKEDRAGNADNYHRLAALDATLQRMIQRFEDEYPDARPEREIAATDQWPVASPPESPDISRVNSVSEARNANGLNQNDDGSSYPLRLSRTPSNTSLAARALMSEEGRMHRFGQSMRRDLLKPTGTDDFAHGTSVEDPPDPAHFASLRQKLEKLEGEEIRQRVEEYGPETVRKQLGLTLEELRTYRLDDPEGYEKFRQSNLVADLNRDLGSS